MKKRRNENKWIFVTSADMKQFYIAAKARQPHHGGLPTIWQSLSTRPVTLYASCGPWFSTHLWFAAQEKGRFQHSSFLAGGAVGAAGQIAVDHGRIVKMAPMSGTVVHTAVPMFLCRCRLRISCECTPSPAAWLHDVTEVLHILMYLRILPLLLALCVNLVVYIRMQAIMCRACLTMLLSWTG